MSGPASTMAELAQVVSRNCGRTVICTDLPLEQHAQVLVGAGLPEAAAAVYADGDRG